MLSSSTTSTAAATAGFMKSVRVIQSKLFVLIAFVSFIIAATAGTIVFCVWSMMSLYRITSDARRKYADTRRLVAGKYVNSFVNATINDVWRNVTLTNVHSVFTANAAKTYDDSVFAEHTNDDLTMKSKGDIEREFIERTAACNNDGDRSIADLLASDRDNYDMTTNKTVALCPKE